MGTTTWAGQAAGGAGALSRGGRGVGGPVGSGGPVLHVVSAVAVWKFTQVLNEELHAVTVPWDPKMSWQVLTAGDRQEA